jgi:hypothetical protein
VVKKRLRHKQICAPSDQARGVRARIDHVFGAQQNSLGGRIVRTLGVIPHGWSTSVLAIVRNGRVEVFLFPLRRQIVAVTAILTTCGCAVSR